MKYRSRIQITSQILQAADGGGATRTKIMYKAFLNFVQLEEYLKILTEGGLLDYDSESRTFKTTPKGLIVIECCNQLDDIVKEQSQQRRLPQQLWA
jgi:predicted transcriptional regulator